MLTVRMKEYRKKCGITQAEMAKACHLSPIYVSALERGIYQPNAETLILWAAKCGVSIDALIGYERCSHINADPVSDGSISTDKAIRDSDLLGYK